MRSLTLLIALACFAPAAAFAQQDLAQSDRHYEEGSRLYHEGEYSRAILELKAGYDLAAHPIFLVNIALAYAKLGNWAEAATWGDRAIREPGLDGDAAAQTGGRSRAWNLRDVSERLVAEVLETRSLVVSEPLPPLPPEPVPRSWGAIGWAGVVGAGTGILAIGGATAIGALLQDDRRAFEAAGAAGDEGEFLRLKDRIDSQQVLGRVLLFSGIGLVAVGGTLVLVDALTVETRVALTPAGPTLVGVVRW